MSGPGGREVPRLMLLTDRSQLTPAVGLVETVAECVRVGLPAVVLREHDLEPARRSRVLEQLLALDDGSGAFTVLSSRVDDPLAHGVHLSAHQPVPPGGTWWGRSCHGVAEVAAAARQGAGWVTLSPFGLSASKPGYGPALPLAACAGHDVPVIALGGIDTSLARQARNVGAHGVAVMGAVR